LPAPNILARLFFLDVMQVLRQAKRRILVTGATGFVGRHLVPALHDRGYFVRTGSRDPAVASFDPAIERISIGDIGRETVDWRACLSGMDVVIHLAGIAHVGSSIPAEEYERVNRRATARLAEAARACDAKLIFISSVAAQSGPAATRILTEADIPSPNSAYGYSKLNAERDIAAIGGRYSILRPTLVYGYGARGNMARLIRLAQMPVPLPLGAVRNLRSLLAIQNLVDAIILLLEHNMPENGTFLIADEEPISLPAIITALRRGLGHRPNLLSFPPTVLAYSFRLVGLHTVWERIAGSLVVSTQRFHQIGYSPKIRTEDGLQSFARETARDKIKPHQNHAGDAHRSRS
jgi:nucleoside-diphosphate-sugar epimerase